MPASQSLAQVTSTAAQEDGTQAALAAIVSLPVAEEAVLAIEEDVPQAPMSLPAPEVADTVEDDEDDDDEEEDEAAGSIGARQLSDAEHVATLAAFAATEARFQSLLVRSCCSALTSTVMIDVAFAAGLRA